MTILFIHGFESTPEINFYPTIRPLLEEAGIGCSVPAMPHPFAPVKEEWLGAIKQAFDQVEGPVILVGHSLGTRAALLFLETYPVLLAATLLIAAFDNRASNAARRHGAYASFFDHEIDVALIKSCCPKFVVMHSKDDDSIPYLQAESIAHDLGADLITYTDRRHFSEPENAPEIMAQIAALI
jgi:predicted alpha/beta hydrolase family esterase